MALHRVLWHPIAYLSVFVVLVSLGLFASVLRPFIDVCSPVVVIYLRYFVVWFLIFNGIYTFKSVHFICPVALK